MDVVMPKRAAIEAHVSPCTSRAADDRKSNAEFRTLALNFTCPQPQPSTCALYSPEESTETLYSPPAAGAQFHWIWSSGIGH